VNTRPSFCYFVQFIIRLGSLVVGDRYRLLCAIILIVRENSGEHVGTWTNCKLQDFWLNTKLLLKTFVTALIVWYMYIFCHWSLDLCTILIWHVLLFQVSFYLISFASVWYVFVYNFSNMPKSSFCLRNI
jgi:hypothetical protein